MNRIYLTVTILLISLTSNCQPILDTSNVDLSYTLAKEILYPVGSDFVIEIINEDLRGIDVEERKKMINRMIGFWLVFDECGKLQSIEFIGKGKIPVELPEIISKGLKMIPRFNNFYFDQSHTPVTADKVMSVFYFNGNGELYMIDNLKK